MANSRKPRQSAAPAAAVKTAAAPVAVRAEASAPAPARTRATARAKADVPVEPVVAQPPAPRKAGMARPKKQVLVKDEFAVPAEEYVQLAVLKQRAQSVGIKAKKNQLLRIGLQLVMQLDEKTLADSLAALTPITRKKTAKRN